MNSMLDSGLVLEEAIQLVIDCRIDEAVVICAQVFESNPKDKDVHFLLWLLDIVNDISKKRISFLIENNYASAEEDARKSAKISLSDYLSPIAEFISAIIRSNSNSDESLPLAFYRQKLCKSKAKAYHDLGFAFKKKQFFGVAISSYTRAIAIDPDEPLLYFRRGMAYNELKKSEEAIQDFAKSINNETNSQIIMQAHFNRGIAYLDQLKCQLAVDDFRQSIRLGNAEAEPYLTRAVGMVERKVEILEMIKNKMVLIDLSDHSYWLGKYKDLGIVLYDPLSQINVQQGSIRLFVQEASRMQQFDLQDLLRIVEIDNKTYNKTDSDILIAVETYDYYRTKSYRETGCYKCKSLLNSIDFAICDKCHWIRCSCGACGCQYLAQ